MATAQGEIRVGIGGWVFEPWRGAFYPEGLAGWTVLGVAALAAPGALVEIKAIAHIPATPAS